MALALAPERRTVGAGGDALAAFALGVTPRLGVRLARLARDRVGLRMAARVASSLPCALGLAPGHARDTQARWAFLLLVPLSSDLGTQNLRGLSNNSRGCPVTGGRGRSCRAAASPRVTTWTASAFSR